MKLNKNFSSLKESYLFVEITNRVNKYKAEHPEADIIKLGIGDVTRPLAKCVVDAGIKAVKEMGDAATFRGYSPDSQGYDFLREQISRYYLSFGVSIDPCEIHISDGAKSDCGNIVDMFDEDNTVLIPNPVYPVYMDSNIMAGHKIEYIEGNKLNGFAPHPPKDKKADIIYLCYPNNPTGAVLDYDGLKEWIDYANFQGAVILYDSAYEAFITDSGIPRSIFAVEGSRTCCIELCSFSKTCGFTGTRCGYTVIPKELCEGRFGAMWARRQSTKYNGTSYIQQRMAEAAYSKEGIEQCRQNIAVYQKNAKAIASSLDELGIYYTGGINSPYIWLECPFRLDSWSFFDLLLTKANVVGTPGAGFGLCGEGYFRLTAFGTEDSTQKALEKIKALF